MNVETLNILTLYLLHITPHPTHAPHQ